MLILRSLLGSSPLNLSPRGISSKLNFLNVALSVGILAVVPLESLPEEVTL